MKRFINLLLFTLPMLCTAQQLPLDSILQHIYRTHPMLAEYRSRAGAWEAMSEGTTAWMAPMAGLGTFMTPYHRQHLEEMDKGSVMFSVEQTVPNRARAKAARNAMMARAGQEEARGLQQWNMLRTEARRAVYAWSAADEQLEQLARQKSMLETMLDLARNRYRNGQGAAYVIYQAEARLGQIRNMIAETETMKSESVAMLRGLMGLPQQSEIRPVRILPDFNPEQIATDTTLLTERRSDVREINAQIKQLKLEQTVRELQRKPDYRLRFDHMQPIGQGVPAQFTAMAMVTIPIAPWSAGMYKSEVRGLDRDIRAMEHGRQARIRDAHLRLNTLTQQLTGLKTQLHGYETEILPALQQAFDALRIAWSENKESLTMVLDAWESINMARSEYLTKKQKYYQLISDYEAILEN